MVDGACVPAWWIVVYPSLTDPGGKPFGSEHGVLWPCHSLTGHSAVYFSSGKLAKSNEILEPLPFSNRIVSIMDGLYT